MRRRLAPPHAEQINLAIPFHRTRVCQPEAYLTAASSGHVSDRRARDEFATHLRHQKHNHVTDTGFRSLNNVTGIEDSHRKEEATCRVYGRLLRGLFERTKRRQMTG